MAVVILWVLCGIGAAMAAANKGRSIFGWFILGALLGPFGILFALLSRDLRQRDLESAAPRPPRPAPPAALSIQGEKTCPACGETIQLSAIKCRFCGERFSPEQLGEHLSQAGYVQCPDCGRWEVTRAYVEGGGLGLWCPHCQKAV